MKIESFTLNNTETISNKLNTIDSGSTLINAPTGTGKTTFVLQQLTEQYKILMLVPLVAQVNQLRATYHNRPDMFFLSGSDNATSKNSTPLKSHQDKHIIATYDMLPTLNKHINLSNRLLIVDEIHKSYSAGLYRDEAINPLFDALNSKKTFVKKLMLTATYTEQFGDAVNLTPDNLITFTANNAPKRQLSVEYYQEPWSYHWLNAVINRLKKRTCDKKIVFVRLNSNARMEKAIGCLEKMGYRALQISRSTINTADVKKIIQQESLSSDYDVILTTSIFDEAINLNNKEGDIDSVHIVDASAHPEEVVQFMGRLRKANPPFFLHIQKKNDDFLSPISQQKEQKTSAIESKYKTLYALAAATKAIADTFTGEEEAALIASAVKTINTTMQNQLQCALLTTINDQTRINKASIIAYCYKTDVYYTYRHYEQLKSRLEQLLPTLDVTLNICKKKPNQKLGDLIEKYEEEQAALALQATTTVCDYIKTECSNNDKSLLQYGNEVLEAIENKVFNYPFDRRTQPNESNQYMKAIHLTRHLRTEEDIKRALKENDYHHIVELSASYSHNILYNEIRALLKVLLDAQQTKIYPEAAGKLVLKAIKKTVTIIPTFKNAIIKAPIKGLSYDDANKKYEIGTGKAMNLIGQIADVKDKNAHKPERRYLLLTGIAWKGYNFTNANSSPLYHAILRKKEPKLIQDDVDPFA